MKHGNKQSIFFILGGGGHTAQMILLQNDFPDSLFEKYFVVGSRDSLSEKKVRNLGYANIYQIDRYKKTEESLLSASVRNLLFFGIIKQLSQSIKVSQLMHRNILITAGPNTGMLLFIIARLSGNYCVYLESWSRRKKLSKTGALLKYFSNLFFVQWKELGKLNSKFIYKGRLM